MLGLLGVGFQLINQRLQLDSSLGQRSFALFGDVRKWAQQLITVLRDLHRDRACQPQFFLTLPQSALGQADSFLRFGCRRSIGRTCGCQFL